MKQYRFDIEGLRAVAVIPVILYHFNLGFSGGYVGVDIFFVISGYLISSLLLEDMDAGRFSMVAFWERRVRRIFPAMIVVATACTVAAAALMLPQDFRKFGRSLAAQMYFGSNFHFWRNTGYFEAPAESMPLLHTWSLAVEEQFYIVFPMLLFYLKRFRKPVVIVTLLAVFSLAVSIYGVRHFPSAAFYLPHSRAWELFVGALAAMVRSPGAFPRWICELAALIGAAAVGICLFIYDVNTPFPGEAAILPCVGAALLIWANEHRPTFIGRFLSLRPLTWVGALSYSLYLWHWPILVLVRYWTVEPLSIFVRMILISATFVISWISWKYIETPFRKKRFLPERGRLFRIATQTAAALLIAGMLIHAFRGFPQRFPKKVLAFADTTAEMHLPHNKRLNLNSALAGNFPVVGATNPAASSEFVIWGDSHAMALIPVLDRLGRDYSVRGYSATYSSRIPALQFYKNEDFDAVPFNNAVLELIQKRRIKDVLIAARWGNNCDVAFTAPRRERFVGSAAMSAFERQLKFTIETIHREGCKVWIVLDVPDHKFDAPRALAAAALFGKNPETDVAGISTELYREEGAFMRGLVPKMIEWGALIFDPMSYLTNTAGTCPVIRNGKALYRDAHHLSVHGTLELRPMFEPMFQEMAKHPPR